MRSLADVIQQLSANPETGLLEAQVAQSRQQFGKNELTPLPREPLWQKFLGKFDEPIIKILLAAALLSMIVELFKSSTTAGAISFGVVAVLLAAAYALRQRDWVPAIMFSAALSLFFVGLALGHVLVEGLAVMVAVILATGVSFASEYKSDREFEVLNAHKDSLKSKTLRGGQLRSLPVEEVVVGDVILLETGDEIPADGRLLKAAECMIDQSLMTGESLPVRKLVQPLEDRASGPDQPACLYRGTQVMDGTAHLMVTEVGDETSLGQIARRLSAEPMEEETAPDSTEEARVKRRLTLSKALTPLQQKLTHLAGLISKVGYIAAGLILVAQLLRGLWVGEIFWPTDSAGLLSVLSELLGYFVTMVIVIVVAVPEGLPMSVTVSLALAMQKMTRAHSLVRQLVACETIGSATVICSDKTGTMTQNKMRVDLVSWDDHACARGTAQWLPPQMEPIARPIDWIALISAVNSTANLEEKQGKTITLGNSTEGALLQWLREAGVPYSELRLRHPVLYQIHFSSERKRMTTVISMQGRSFALVKGGPEALLHASPIDPAQETLQEEPRWRLDACGHYLDADGSVQRLDDSMRQAIQKRLDEAAGKAMRTLAFAYAPLPADVHTTADNLHAQRGALEKDLVYVGFVAIRDPLREDVKDAVAQCRHAGIEVKMITGDNVETARAIGHEIGLVARADEPIDTPDAVVRTSRNINAMSDEQLKGCLPRLRIVARAQPLDKFRLVRLLQELGEVVAVTGDGTNDAPALKRADVGLAMGIAGTEVAKEASKIVLLDDSFATIVKAVHWGRSLYENIQRFIQFQLTINVSALAITFIGILLGVKAPFTVLQLLWINVIMDTFASIALCSEPPRPGVMKLPPKKRSDNILTPAMMRTIFSTAAFFILTMLGLLMAMEHGLLRGHGPWSVEVAGNRFAVDRNDPRLQPIQGDNWTYQESPEGVPQHAIIKFTVYQVSLFFSIYVFFQVWNQINSRALTPEMSGFQGIWHNPTFLTIAALVAAGQILIVTFGGTVFKVEPLDLVDWLGVIFFTSTVLIFAEISRRLRLRTAT